jgi:hypothetical protein
MKLKNEQKRIVENLQKVMFEHLIFWTGLHKRQLC